jgi:hypothetical protein
MLSFGMLRYVAVTRTDISEDLAWNIGFLRSVRRLPVIANVLSSSPILVTLMIETLDSSEMLVVTRATRRNIPEDGILLSRRCENLKS